MKYLFYEDWEKENDEQLKDDYITTLQLGIEQGEFSDIGSFKEFKRILYQCYLEDLIADAKEAK